MSSHRFDCQHFRGSAICANAAVIGSPWAISWTSPRFWIKGQTSRRRAVRRNPTCIRGFADLQTSAPRGTARPRRVQTLRSGAGRGAERRSSHSAAPARTPQGARCPRGARLRRKNIRESSNINSGTRNRALRPSAAGQGNAEVHCKTLKVPSGPQGPTLRPQRRPSCVAGCT